MGEPTHRAARRNLTTQPAQGRRPKPATVKPNPISPEEIAWMIARAREERKAS